jgi:hypothetical protein
MDTEETLPGGNLGGAIRVGDTVRRQVGRWTPAVHALLDHLESTTFEAAPRALGFDGLGREILSYIEGETAEQTDPWPAWVWSDETLWQAGALLRSYHDAIRGFEPAPDSRWRLPCDALKQGHVVCHNDWAPYNVVRRGGEIVGVIDWDVAGPGDPRQDLAIAAWQWIPMYAADLVYGEPLDILSRLHTLCDAYGLKDRSTFVEEVSYRARVRVDRILQGAEGDPGLAKLRDRGLVAEMERSVIYMEASAPNIGRGFRELGRSRREGAS